MEDIDIQKLQKQAFPTMIYSVAVLVVFYAFILLFTNTYEVTTMVGSWMPIILGLATCGFSYKIFEKNFRQATYVLIGGLVLAVISFVFQSPSDFGSFYGYLLPIVVSIAGVFIGRNAVIEATIFATLVTIIAAVTLSFLGWNDIYIMLRPMIMTIVMAVISVISSDHLTETAKWALQSQKKAAKRSQDLFQSQQETKKAHAQAETAKVRAEQAEATARELYFHEERRRQATEILFSSSRALSRTLDLDEVLNLILQHLSEIVPYERASLMDKQDNNLKFLYTRGFPERIDQSNVTVPIQPDEGDVFYQIYQSQQPLSVDDVVKRGNWRQVEGLPITHSWLGVPLIRFDKVIGMLSLVREKVAPFSEEEITMASAFSGEAAIALENARLYDKLARFSQHLEEMVKERTEELFLKSEELQKANERLERLDRTKTDFIKIASHELRTPLTTMNGYTQMLMSDKTIKGNPFHLEMVKSIYAGTTQLHEIINTILDVAKIDEQVLEVHAEELFMAHLVEKLRLQLEAGLAERNLTFQTENLGDLPSIEADVDGMKKAFYHLIINAIKYTPDGGKITIGGRRLPAGQPNGLDKDAVEITILDTGIGIDAQYHELIFEKFYQTGKQELHSSGKFKFMGAGPGLGLAIVQGIVLAHDGKVWVESPGHDEEKFPGSTFHIVLPVQCKPEKRAKKSSVKSFLK